MSDEDHKHGANTSEIGYGYDALMQAAREQKAVLDAEVEAIAEAVFDLKAQPQRWSTTTESMRTIYRASIRKALAKARATLRPPEVAEHLGGRE